MDYGFIVIEGNIGAGKTSLAQKIADDFKGKLIPEEFAENPFLPKFYKNPEKYSFPLELTFLADRYQQLKNEIQDRELFRSLIVSDYYFTKSLIFAKNTLSNDEFSLYRRIFNIIYASLPKPDLYVFLHADVDKLKKNINNRGRLYEKDIKPDYLKKIQQSYFEFIRLHEKEYRFLIIDVNKIDFVGNETHYLEIKRLLFENEYDFGVNRFIL